MKEFLLEFLWSMQGRYWLEARVEGFEASYSGQLESSCMEKLVCLKLSMLEKETGLFRRIFDWQMKRFHLKFGVFELAEMSLMMRCLEDLR